MVEEKTELIISDWSVDSHDRTNRIPIIIEVKNEDDAVKYLKNTENVLFEQYNIDLSAFDDFSQQIVIRLIKR
jgi:hypothetical protein